MVYSFTAYNLGDQLWRKSRKNDTFYFFSHSMISDHLLYLGSCEPLRCLKCLACSLEQPLPWTGMVNDEHRTHVVRTRWMELMEWLNIKLVLIVHDAAVFSIFLSCCQYFSPNPPQA